MCPHNVITQRFNSNLVDVREALQGSSWPENLVVPRGSTVRIHGLLGARELNGQMGVVEAFDEADGRHTVLVVGEARPKRIKQSNCQPCLNYGPCTTNK